MCEKNNNKRNRLLLWNIRRSVKQYCGSKRNYIHHLQETFHSFKTYSTFILFITICIISVLYYCITYILKYCFTNIDSQIIIPSNSQYIFTNDFVRNRLQMSCIIIIYKDNYCKWYIEQTKVRLIKVTLYWLYTTKRPEDYNYNLLRVYKVNVIQTKGRECL